MKKQRTGHAQYDAINLSKSSEIEECSPSLAPHFAGSSSTRSYPTTNFLGWRRLRIEEILALRICQSLIIVIPTEVRTEDIGLKKRRDIKKRLVGHIASSCPDLRRDEVLDYLDEYNGIARNDSTYIELPCVVKAYGERDDLLAGINLKWHLGKGGSGILFDLLDYPNSKSFHIKLKELPGVQYWVEHFRGDLCPQISLTNKRVVDSYCDVIHDHFD